MPRLEQASAGGAAHAALPGPCCSVSRALSSAACAVRVREHAVLRSVTSCSSKVCEEVFSRSLRVRPAVTTVAAVLEICQQQMRGLQEGEGKAGGNPDGDSKQGPGQAGGSRGAVE